jgi:hypothetical protein
LPGRNPGAGDRVPRAIAVFALAACGCTSPASTAEFAGANVAPLSVMVTADPPPGADGTLARDAVVRLVLDDFPDPDTAEFGPLLLRSGDANFDIMVSVDLPGRAILLHPRSLLQPDTEYEILVSPNVRALDGRAVGGQGFAATVSTGETLANLPPPAPVQWSDVARTLQLCSPMCHSPMAAGGVPVRSLDFFRLPTDPVYGLIEVPSLSQAGTAHPLARVTPGDSARSVLLRKLLGGDASAASGDPPYPEIGVDGRRMPIQLDPATQPSPPPPLDDASIRAIQQWIDGGATS